MDPIEEQPAPSGKVFIYKGKEPKLSKHAEQHFARKKVTICLLPSNSRGDETDVINGG
jgi:hypothetical protein